MDDLYRQAGRRAGYSPDQLKVGIHSLGYVAERTQEAVDDFYPGYAHTMSEIGKERGWRKMTRESFDAQRGPQGALLVGQCTFVAAGPSFRFAQCWVTLWGCESRSSP